jgi:hypothetical protein
MSPSILVYHLKPNNSTRFITCEANLGPFKIKIVKDQDGGKKPYEGWIYIFNRMLTKEYGEQFISLEACKSFHYNLLMEYLKQCQGLKSYL